MRILYIARHGQANSNDDEGAIAFALRKLGHDVICYQERFNVDIAEKCDFCLFHHWHDIGAMLNLRQLGIPLVFFNFDLVEWPDPTLEARNVMRRTWMNEVMKVADLGFVTDGNWQEKHPDRLVWLPQGFDERQRPAPPQDKTVDILFTGIGKGGGTQRESFVHEMYAKYGERFLHYQRGLHGDRLALVIAKSKIVVAPDSPVTDRYWSNRVYNMLGMGGFLLHPFAQGLAEQYANSNNWRATSYGLVFYKDYKELHRKIEHYLDNQDIAGYLADQAHKRTLEAHTYTRRCEILVATVKARLGL